MTRPGTANALRACARHSHNPIAITLLIVHTIGSAFAGSCNLMFVRGSALRLCVYAKAYYAAVSNDRRSVSGVAVM